MKCTNIKGERPHASAIICREAKLKSVTPPHQSVSSGLAVSTYSESASSALPTRPPYYFISLFLKSVTGRLADDWAFSFDANGAYSGERGNSLRSPRREVAARRKPIGNKGKPSTCRARRISKQNQRRDFYDRL
jgi:hypothetical protein